MSQTLSLPPELTIYTVGELRPQWLSWLADAAQAGSPSGEYAVEAGAVDQVDAAGVQLLLSLGNAVAQRERRLQVLNPSMPLAEACAALGVSSLLLPDAQGVAA